MSNPSKKPNGTPPDALGEMISQIFLMVLLTIVAGAGLTFKVLKERPELYTHSSIKRRALLALVSLVMAGALFSAGKFIDLATAYRIVVFVLASWAIGFFVVWSTAGLWLRSVIDDRVTTRLVKNKAPNMTALNELLSNPSAAPVGISLRDFSPVLVTTRQRIEHMIIAGATGQGKTTLMMTLLKHDFLHRRPVIIIDPKGEKDDINRIRSFVESLGRDPSDFKLFTLANPELSAKYNPLSQGTPQMRRAKIMDGFGLTHEYYGSVAGSYIGSLLDVSDFLGIDPSLRLIEEALLSKSYLTSLHNQIRDMEESEETLRILQKVASMRQIDRKDLAGLQAQVETFNSREFLSILSPDPKDDSQIRLVDVLKNGQIAYFQMNVNGYGDIARRIGKMIIQDLKTTASLIHSKQVQFPLEFGACFIDEFGSFATQDFDDFLKQVRSTNIGTHLLCQGMADLRKVSPEFEAQVLGNTVTKFILRTDLAEDAEKWAGMAGTVDGFSDSFQVERFGPWVEHTGAGTRNPSKKMKIEFDVFKSLKRGQAVVINKFSGREDLMSIWDAKSEPMVIPKSFQKASSSASSTTPKTSILNSRNQGKASSRLSNNRSFEPPTSL